MSNRQKISAILVLIGAVLVVISQTVQFTKKASIEPPSTPFFHAPPITYTVENTELKNGVLYAGLGCVLVGGILFVTSAGANTNKGKS